MKMVDITADDVKSTNKCLIPIDKIMHISTMQMKAVKKRAKYLEDNNMLLDVSGQKAGITLIEISDGMGYISSMKATSIQNRIDKLKNNTKTGGNNNGKSNSENQQCNERNDEEL